MTTPALDAAIKAVCKRRATGQCAAICLSHFSTTTTNGGCPEAIHVWREDVLAALRSLATPTPERVRYAAIEVRRRQFMRTRNRAFDETVEPTEGELDNARAALMADWAHILGETK